MPESPELHWWGRPRGRRVLSVSLTLFLIVFTFLLFYYAYFGKRTEILDITPQLAPNNTTIAALNIEAAGNVEHGVVPLVINGTITDPSVSRLTLITGVPGSAVTQVQASCCAISGTTFAGTAQLGTAESPVTSTPVFTFQLVQLASSGPNTPEASGNIAINVKSYLGGGNQFAITVIGVLSFLATLISLTQWGSRPKLPGGTNHV
jgi:hypothetical protein